MKHFTWKRSQCNVMKKKIHLSLQTTKKLIKFMTMNINQQIITLNIYKTPDSAYILKQEQTGMRWNRLEWAGTT